MTPAEQLEAALKPLRFAARRNFANLEVVKNLAPTVRSGLERVSAEAPEDIRRRVEHVRTALEGYEDATPADRKAQARKALAALEGLAPAPGADLFGAALASPPRGERSLATGEARPAVSPRPVRAPDGVGQSGAELGGLFSAAARNGATGMSGSGEEGGATRVSTIPPNASSTPSPTPVSAAPAQSGSGPRTVSAAPEEGEASAETRARRGIFQAAPRPESTDTPRKKLERAEPGDALSKLLGVPPATAAALAKKGVESVQDALFFLPRKLEAAALPKRIEQLRPGERAIVRGVVAASALRGGGKKRYWEMAVRDGTGTLSCRFFRFSKRSFETTYRVGTRVEVEGNVTFFGAQRQMAHPEVRKTSEDDEAVTEATPGRVVYSEVPGIPAKTLTRVLHRIVEATVDRVHDPLPEAIRERNKLARLAPALRAAHFPDQTVTGVIESLRARLAFDELMMLQFALGAARGRREAKPGLQQDAPPWRPIAEQALPFEPTGAQGRALDEIRRDLRAARPMRRLLQGDVGSGKTAVAWLSAAMTHRAGRQCVMLAPTEILAEQHMAGALEVLAKLGMNVALLTGSTPAKARASAVRALMRGDIHVMVGTHALLEPDVRFKDLGLVIVDEQHRFGVEQRARLVTKREGLPPDVLLMTATPIPRTLTMSLYGDLRVSVIDELPPGRTPTVTEVYSAERADVAYGAVREALRAGRQAYVVFPLVEASEQLELRSATEARDELESKLAPHRVGLLHGRMRPDEKSSVMGAFTRGELGVLVSTTVVEVGVNVPNATVMVIEEADRFGLSQLHQLRGRVGRGAHGGHCLLIASSAESSARLAVMAETTDGFRIAERDLELRGPGEMLGTRQSGMPDLFVADLVGDRRLVEAARTEADRLLELDPNLDAVENAAFGRELERRFGDRLDRLAAG